MRIDDWIRLIASTFILLSVGLGLTVSPWFFAFTAFVGLNLLQSGLTHWCPMMVLLRRVGVQEG